MVLLQGKQNLMLSCDWFGYTCLWRLHYGEKVDNLTLCCPQNYRMEIVGGNKVFRCRAILYDWFGQKVLTFLWHPYASIMDKRLVLFEIANSWLYSTKLKEITKLTQEIHENTFLCPSRLDICVDFECNKKQKDILKRLHNGKSYVANKDNGSNYWSRRKGEENIFTHCFSYGANTSEFKWKVYNKSLELGIGTKNEKPYIWQNWEQNNMDINNIWRCEVSITKGNGLLYKEKKITLDDAIDDIFLYNLYRELEEKRFVIRKKQGHTRQVNDERQRFFQLKDYRDMYEQQKKDFSIKPTSEVKEDKEISVGMNAIIRAIESPIAKCNYNVFDNLSQSLLSTISMARLGKYFESLKQMSVDDYINKLREEYGYGIVINE